MFELLIPDFGHLRLAHLVLDYNGTLACDGHLLPAVASQLTALAGQLHVHVLTADTFGNARAELAGLPCQLAILDADRQADAKLACVERLGADACVCIGNGRNDRLMLNAAALGIAVVQVEGAAAAAVLSADVITSSIQDALDLLINPMRLLATLRG